MTSNNKKDPLEKLRKKLAYNKQLAWDVFSKKELKNVEELNASYKKFLDNAKTERLATKRILEIAGENGFKAYDPDSVQDRYYISLNHKTTALVIKGRKKGLEGIRIVGSHVDAPRIDLKQNPLYEDVDIALLKTHYYGGIKKYHWLARPLAIYGTVILGNGKTIEISIGDNPDDPIFVIADLLPHLAGKQREKKLSDAFEGEKLNIIGGGRPVFGSDKDCKERIKLNFLKILNKRYNIVEEDFISAEIEIVPAGKARDVGLDCSFIGAYGQDDRICVFTSLKAILDIKKPEYTSAAIFFDKEEIGSEGATGAKSRFVETVLCSILKSDEIETNTFNILEAFRASRALSADVNGGLDPDYQDVHDKRNAARLGYGVCITKFTGCRGKSGANDANAEYVGWVRNLFNKSSVVWQTGELGKVDEGGGGTIAKFLAAHGMDVVDCGPPLLSMHAPFELSSKADVFAAYRAYLAFFMEP
ncbi:MAG: aminopeptidase [Deltaproteobacteria bacterium]|nr:aminopeptidase [Deltaproteobacteria bacterium]MBW2661147.1 aminopeptidase [Deltaproteobacteria bacterium]